MEIDDQECQFENFKWEFPWDLMDVMIGGKSSIDLTRLELKSFEDAHQFFVSLWLRLRAARRSAKKFKI